MANIWIWISTTIQILSFTTDAYIEKCILSENTRLCKKLYIQDYVGKIYYIKKVLHLTYCQDIWSTNRQPAIICYEQYGEREREEYSHFNEMRLFKNGIYTTFYEKLGFQTKCVENKTIEVNQYFYNLSETDYDFWRLCPYGWKRSCTKEGITCISRNGGFENQRFYTRNQIPILRNESTWLPIALQVSTGLYYTSKEIVPVIQDEVICIMPWTELNAQMNNYRCHDINNYGCEQARNSFCFKISGNPGNRFRIKYNFELIQDKALITDIVTGVYCLDYMPFAYIYCMHSTTYNETFMIDESWGGRHKTIDFMFHFLIQRLEIEVPTTKKIGIRIIGLTIFAILFSLLYIIIKNGISF